MATNTKPPEPKPASRHSSRIRAFADGEETAVPHQNRLYMFESRTPTPSPRPALLKIKAPKTSRTIAQTTKKTPKKRKVESQEDVSVVTVTATKRQKLERKDSPNEESSKMSLSKKSKAVSAADRSGTSEDNGSSTQPSLVVRPGDAARLIYYNEIEPPHYFSQYLPGSEDARNRFRQQSHPKGIYAGHSSARAYKAANAVSTSSISPYAKRGGILAFLQQCNRPSALNSGTKVETNKKKEIGGSALRSETPALAYRVEDEVLVQCSLFVGVLLNIQARYDVDVTGAINEVMGKLADHEMQEDQRPYFQNVSESASQVLGAHRSQSCISNEHPGLPWMVQSTASGLKSLVRRWDTVCPGLLGSKGRKLLRVNLSKRYGFENDLLGLMGLPLGLVDGIGRRYSVLRAEIEAEAEQRTQGPVAFRGLDGQRSFSNQTVGDEGPHDKGGFSTES